MPTEKNQFVDLHMHSTFSDGTFTPSEIVIEAKKNVLYAIALTDHDTIDGIEEFLEIGIAEGIETVPGVEISCIWNRREIHILGLWVDYKNQELVSFLNQVVINRNKRNEEIIQQLNENLFDITLDELKNKAKGDIAGRVHIASILVEKGYCRSIQDAFSSLLTYGAKCYLPRILPSVKEAVEIIHLSGGLAVWAHAVHKNNKGNSNLKGDMISLKNLGLDAIEGFYPEYSPRQQQLIGKYAKSLDLLLSGGSDFHGKNRDGIKIGSGYGDLRIPVDLYFKLKNRIYLKIR